MNNKIDKLLRYGVNKHHLPNDGPKWDELEKLMKPKKRWPYVQIISTGVILLALSFFFSNINSTSVVTPPPASVDENPQTASGNYQSNNNGESKTINSENAKTRIIAENQPAKVPHSTGNNSIPRSQASDINPSVSIDEGSGHADTKTDLDKDQKATVEIMPYKEFKFPVNRKKPGEKNVPEKLKMRGKLRLKNPELLSVFVGFSPSLINSTDIITTDNKTHKKYADYRAKGEKMRSGLGFDLGFKFSPFKKLSISSGVILEERLEKVDYRFKRNEVPVIDGSTGEIFGYIILQDTAAEKVDYSGTNIYRYVGIPLNIHYQPISWGRFGFGISLSANYLKQNHLEGKTINRSTLELEDLTSGVSTQLKSMFNAGCGINFNYRLTRSLLLSVSPSYKTQLTKNNAATRAQQATLSLNLQYKLL